jgi:FkbM family methyltransferase
LNRFIFNKAGFHVTRLQESSTLSGLLLKLSDLGLIFESVFDVGAYKGKWSKEFKSTYPKASFFLFEPNDVHNEDIASLGFKVFNLLLGRKSGEKVKFFSGGQTGDSYFLEKNLFYLGTEKEVELHSLADVIRDHSLPIPDFLKLDTQGSELEILKGAEEILSQIKVVLVELPITRMNIGAASLSEVVDYMESKNFVPIHLTEVHVVIDILVQVDITFLRRDLFVEKYGHDDISHRNINPNL